MAANKFASMLQKNTYKMTLILIYAVLEWTLIILLLLNSLFSYLILKFADYFDLKPPCLWCARIDRFFEPEKKNSHRDHLCELHCKEISKLSYCSNHLKLADSQDMCEDCSSSKPGFRLESENLSKKFLFSEVKQIDAIHSDGEDDVSFKCSCCGVDFERRDFDNSSYFVIHPSLDILEYTRKGNSITEIVPDGLIGSDLVSDHFEETLEIQRKEDNQNVKQTAETEIEAIKEDNLNIITRESNFIEHDLIQFEKSENSTSEIPSHDLEFFFDYSGNQLVPIELIDSTTDENQNISEVDEDHEFGDYQKAHVTSESGTDKVTEELVKEIREFMYVHQNTDDSHKVNENSSKFAELASMEMEETENSLVFHANLRDFTNQEVAIAEEIQTPSTEEHQQNAVATEESDSDSDSDVHSVHEEAEVSIGTEIPVLDSCDEIKAQDNFSLYAFSHEEPSTSSHEFHLNIENDFEEAHEEDITREMKNLNIKVNGTLNEIEEEKIPDTPKSIDSLNHLHKKFLMLERKESGAEESFDGSVMSEMDYGDPVNTAEKIKSALKAETLNALYAELEEERNASAIAANQTMAMINRLQEEKAAMQMEALQYQRMMEEQSEYDQEALQLLNERMMKREREKQELEKELEIYKKKVSDYEMKERMRFLSRSTESCSHSEDGEMSMELNGNHEFQHQNTPIDAVINLESSLTDFEEERLSILEQLKVLESKLFTLSDEEDQHFADIRPIDDYYEEIGKHLNNGNHDFDGIAIGNGIRTMGSSGKRLLPLFDAISTESDDGMMVSNGYENGLHSKKMENAAIVRFELEKKRIDIEEEVDQLYGRLQAMEADREFLKHCIGSLKKGDKGMELLQEILQHLRDLRNVDLRAKNFTDTP